MKNSRKKKRVLTRALFLLQISHLIKLSLFYTCIRKIRLSILQILKTEAGENRKVPIHPKIYHLVEQHYNSSAKYDSEYIFIRPDGKNITYSHLKNVYDKMLTALNLNPEHRPHDGRVYFITKAKNIMSTSMLSSV